MFLPQGTAQAFLLPVLNLVIQYVITLITRICNTLYTFISWLYTAVVALISCTVLYHEIFSVNYAM